MRGKVRTIEAAAFVHETEDRQKIEAAIKNLIPRASIQEEDLQGHYGTSIKKINLKVEGPGTDEETTSLLSKMGAFEKGDIYSRIMEGIERNKIYIRIDKQELVRNLIKLNGDNQIKIIITFYSANDTKEYLAKQGR
ncbi:MAG: exosome protein [Nitrososphaerota archaeon]|nr:exosome protein [Nitrososphaerota archaeon]MDG6929798.1 exosome protein [Nitrososphaerota archaeon]